ncbi:hypothetical protein [uncultured Phenylobacterium sp.]|uniref:hypothetical protein n=1 Tax=uncultured Phenylobacterium sp. TaxID=349273 RepID=UPI0025FC527D|nr:hypothetical protein [uncultured Phenylobacterium sp.]
MTIRTTLAAAVAVVALPAGAAHAQTAGDINRLNQAVQICNSPMGAGMAECAKLRARLGGGGGGGPGLGGFGGGKAQVAVGLLGILSQGRAAAAPPAAASQPGVSPAAVQQAISTCVQNARGDNTAIQACLQIANAAHAPVAPRAPTLGIAAYQSPPSPGGTAAAIHQGGQSYQACAAANPTNWQSCLPLLNGGQPR